MRWTESGADERDRADGEVCVVLAPDADASLLKQFGRRRWQKSSAHRGEREISRKPLRRESRMPPLNLYALCVFSLCRAHETRVQRASGFPAPSCFLGVKIEAKLGCIAPARMRTHILSLFDN